MRRERSLVLKVAAIIAVGSAPILGFMRLPHSTDARPEFQMSGRELFLDNCARCHGDDAKGDKGPDLTARKRQGKWAGSEEPLINKINKGGLFMPKFGKKLNPQEIKEIADYVRSLGK
jgi:cytochrome c oxidase cbb3-type subunit 3